MTNEGARFGTIMWHIQFSILSSPIQVLTFDVDGSVIDFDRVMEIAQKKWAALSQEQMGYSIALSGVWCDQSQVIRSRKESDQCQPGAFHDET